MTDNETLADWIDRQYRFSASAMLESISAITITKTRPGFGQTVTPRRGSIVASPVLADWNPDPDYFFHWFRDSAIIIDAVRVLHDDGTLGPEAPVHFEDFVRFSLSLNRLDGKALADDPNRRTLTIPKFQQYLRPGTELSAVKPADVVGETRVNPDGTLDISRWSRPQHDGPALRIITVLRWLAGKARLSDDCRAAANELLLSDIDFTLRHRDEPSFDIWEEEMGEHYYTQRVQATALERAGDWLKQHDPALAETCRKAASVFQRSLDSYWLESEGFYRSRLSGAASKYLDISVVFAVIHAGDDGPLHTAHDVRMLATMRKLEELFDREYAINHGRPAKRAPALGRYSGDVYFSGGAYYFSTLAGAEFYYRLAASCTGDLARTCLDQGDAFLETVRAFTPQTGELSEQFDRNTGQQTSARKLAWSYAALITAVAARRASLTTQR